MLLFPMQDHTSGVSLAIGSPESSFISLIEKCNFE